MTGTHATIRIRILAATGLAAITCGTSCLADATPESLAALQPLIDGPATQVAEELAACAGVSDASALIMSKLEQAETSVDRGLMADRWFGMAMWTLSSQGLSRPDQATFEEAQENAEARALLMSIRTERAVALVRTVQANPPAAAELMTEAHRYCAALAEAFVRRSLGDPERLNGP